MCRSINGILIQTLARPELEEAKPGPLCPSYHASGYLAQPGLDSAQGKALHTPTVLFGQGSDIPDAGLYNPGLDVPFNLC